MSCLDKTVPNMCAECIELLFDEVSRINVEFDPVDTLEDCTVCCRESRVSNVYVLGPPEVKDNKNGI